MPEPFDTRGWPRRTTYDHFRGYAHPWFSVCVRVDASPLKQALKQAPGAGGGMALALHWCALTAMQPIEAFRLRFAGDAAGEGPLHRVERLHAGTTVARPDESFSFAVLHADDDFASFARRGRLALDAAREGQPPPQPDPDDSTLVHCTTLPWLHFTSFTHAREASQGGDNPKLAFGQLRAEGGKLWLPLSVDVHHALVDGLHVGRFVQAFEALLQAPGRWLLR